MSDITIYHNPRCSKSRETLRILRNDGVEPTIIEYLKTPPDEVTLDRLLRMLDIEPGELIRTKEDAYVELGLGQKQLTRAELIRVMVENPILIERPIVVKGDEAVLGRPPEKALKLL